MTPSLPIISRLAPTPSGYLHVGNALNFVLTWVMTRADKGTLHLRIDDYDQTRCKERYIDDIFKVLDWLGLDWDRGPFSTHSFYQEHTLKTKMAYYKEKMQALRESSSLVYVCRCSRKEIEHSSTNGVYPFTCKDKNFALHANSSALRLHVKEETTIVIEDVSIQLDKVLGDFILWRKEDLPSYQFASLLDDETIGTNMLVRGYDLLDSSAAQLYLASLLHVKSFQNARFFHHPLLLDAKGVKFSKTHQAQKLDTKASPYSVYKEAAKVLGISEKVETLPMLLEAYREFLSKAEGSAK